jgi:hypothetical protein
VSAPEHTAQLRDGGVEPWLVAAIERLARDQERSLDPYIVTVDEATALAARVGPSRARTLGPISARDHHRPKHPPPSLSFTAPFRSAAYAATPDDHAARAERHHRPANTAGGARTPTRSPSLQHISQLLPLSHHHLPGFVADPVRTHLHQRSSLTKCGRGQRQTRARAATSPRPVDTHVDTQIRLPPGRDSPDTTPGSTALCR